MSSINVLGCVNQDVEFGEVPVGTTVFKILPLKNSTYNTVTYYVTRNKQTNPIYHVFDVNKYEIKVQAGSEFKLKITYTPRIPRNKDFDYFVITDSKHHFFRLRFRGECIGPSVKCSIKNLFFFRTPKRQETKGIFTLTNSSTVPAIFNFDCIEEEQGIFKVDPTCGTLEPEKLVYITVRFLAQNARLYSRNLYCLILHHDPIALNLVGICWNSAEYDHIDSSLRFYPFPREEIIGFRGYFSDSVTIKPVPPPISLTVNYLDFGQLMPENSCQTLTTSFTNHMNHAVEVEWEKVKLFRIYPEKLTIPPKQSALYECRFHPEEQCKLSGAILNGHVSWTYSEHDYSAVNVPIPISLRLIGHSFPQNVQWTPTVSISPNNVILPLSLPHCPSWTTFIIKVHGHLPVLYKLVPPSRSNFIMKPMVGIIRKHQVVAVQLESHSPKKKSYIEQWQIQLNGALENSVPMYIKAQTDVPCVRLGSDNSIHFDPMQPGTQTSLFMPFRNISNCRLQYGFELNDQFEMDPCEGVLGPNEEIFLSIVYNSDINEKGAKTVRVFCHIQCIFTEHCLVGEILNIPIKVTTEVIYSELCALPNTFKSGETEYSTTIKTCFHLFNFGETYINFKLCHDHNLKDVTLTPENGRCGPREKLLIRVEFTARNVGKNNLMIGYKNRLSEYSDDTVGAEGVKYVYKIEYKCTMPILQIIDLEEHNYSLFNNGELWKLLKIDEINAALRETNYGEVSTIEFSVPENQLSSKKFYLIFSIKNTSNIVTTLGLRRRQVCQCQQKESDESFSFRIKYIDCLHKDMLEIEISPKLMAANSVVGMMFKILYLLPDENILSYKLELSHQRTLIMNIYVTGISPQSPVLSVFDQTYTLDMGYVYIGLREPPIFAYWLYNSTDSLVPFKIDNLAITVMCNDDRFPVLKCLNCSGIVRPSSAAPLLFKFWPIEAKVYKVVVPLLLGKKKTKLFIRGRGTTKKGMFQYKDFIHQEPRQLSNNFVSLSVDQIVTEPILMSTSTERFFFIHNRSKDRRFFYSWQPCYIDGLVKIDAVPSNGLLENNDTHSVLIKISSLHEPCSIKILLRLDFVDVDNFNSYNEYMKQINITKTLCKSVSDLDLEESRMVPPEHFVIALPIFVNIIGILDRDTCITIEDQMKQSPWSGIYPDIDEFVTNYFEENKIKERPIRPEANKPNTLKDKVDEVPFFDKCMTEEVMDQLCGDAIFSKYFVEVVKNLKTEPSPAYSQIKFSRTQRDQDREEQTKMCLQPPCASEVVDICQEVILDALQAVFKIGCKPKTS